jgi:hypothetical protein
LQQKQFQWTAVAQKAFEDLKVAMSSTPVLVLLDFDYHIVIKTDACESGVGAILSQRGHPVAFFSKALSKINHKLSVYEKEFLAVLMVVDKWHSYLSRQPFVIKIDHKSLCHLQDQSLSTDMQRKAMVKLAGLQFTLQYKKGVDNKAANALSRMDHNMMCASTSAVVPVWIQEIVSSYATDETAQKLLQELEVASPNKEGFSMSQGLIKHKKKIWVGSNPALQTKIISAFYSSSVGGNSGVQATFQMITKLFS